MEEQLKQIAASYDKGIEYGSQGIDLYKDLPASILNDPDYELYQKAAAEDKLSHSGSIEIQEFLAPAPGKKFADLGCCLNLMFRDYDKWTSSYYGVDISQKPLNY